MSKIDALIIVHSEHEGLFSVETASARAAEWSRVATINSGYIQIPSTSIYSVVI